MPTHLQEIREAEGLSRAALARLANVSESTIQRAEHGRTVSRLTKSRILNALNGREMKLRSYDVADLFEDAT